MNRLPQNAFEHYVRLGPERSHQTVADYFGVSKRAVTKRAVSEKWRQKAAELDETARAGSERKLLESLEEMSERHLRSLRVIQGKALEALRGMPLTSAMEAVRSLEMGIRQERLIRGEPTDRSAVSVEETIKSEYQRWLGSDDGDQQD